MSNTSLAHKESMRNWYIKNKKRILLKRKQYRLDNLEKVKESHKRYYKSNKRKINIEGKLYARNRYLEVIKILGGKCKCGFSDIRALQVHHRNSKTKKHRRDFLKRNYNLSLVEVICANCHMIEHAEERKMFNLKYK